MRNGSLILLLVSLSAMLLCVANAVPICIGRPNGVGGGGNCAGAAYCAPGFYCNNASVCTSYLPVGSPCKLNMDTCVVGSDCRGPTGSQTCVAFASPGESCSTTNTVSTPACGTQACDSNGVCRGGYVNDTCKTNNDCISMFCSGKYCIGYPNTLSCQSTFQCAPGLFCQGFTGLVNGTCVPLLTTGLCPNGGSMCAPGYVCEKQSATDQNQCVAIQSRNPGDYCGTSPTLCKGSNRCINNYCAKSDGDTCNSGSQCGADQTCTCSGMGFAGGTGSCTGTCSMSATSDLQKCISQNCQVGVGTPQFYAGSCVMRLCQGQYNALNNCNDGSSLVASMFFIAIASLFALFNKF